MTAVIQDHAGVIVDFYGDGLIAMWNAPLDQPDHATLACEAGLALLKRLAIINSTWEYRLGRATQFGVGIHTGQAIVGNSGSRNRIKYGPRGLPVTIANRIEKATRSLNQPLLISDETRRQLPAEAVAFRLGQFRLRGIVQPIALHALTSLRTHAAPNSCYVSKHREITKLVGDDDFAAAASHLDSCEGCALDELSLNFMQARLRAASSGCDPEDGRSGTSSDWIIDLAK